MTLRFCRRLVIRFSCLHHLQEAGHLLPTHPDLILTFQNDTSNTNIAQVKKSLLLILIRPDGFQIISHDLLKHGNMYGHDRDNVPCAEDSARQTLCFLKRAPVGRDPVNLRGG